MDWFAEDTPAPTEDERYERWLWAKQSPPIKVHLPFRFQVPNLFSWSPHVRRVVPGLIDFDPVGIQPLSASQGLILSMRFNFDYDL